MSDDHVTALRLIELESDVIAGGTPRRDIEALIEGADDPVALCKALVFAARMVAVRVTPERPPVWVTFEGMDIPMDGRGQVVAQAARDLAAERWQVVGARGTLRLVAPVE